MGRLHDNVNVIRRRSRRSLPSLPLGRPPGADSHSPRIGATQAPIVRRDYRR